MLGYVFEVVFVLVVLFLLCGGSGQSGATAVVTVASRLLCVVFFRRGVYGRRVSPPCGVLGTYLEFERVLKARKVP